MRKGRKKANGNPSRSANDRQLVEALTAKGLSGDVISELLNVNKNRLRREHAVALHIGRMKAKKAESRNQSSRYDPRRNARGQCYFGGVC